MKEAYRPGFDSPKEHERYDEILLSLTTGKMAEQLKNGTASPQVILHFYSSDPFFTINFLSNEQT